MKDRERMVAEKLAHALTFVRLAKEAKFAELAKQHLDEAERLIEYSLGVMESEGGENQDYDDLMRECDCGTQVKVTKPTPESIAWDCPNCGGHFMEADV